MSSVRVGEGGSLERGAGRSMGDPAAAPRALNSPPQVRGAQKGLPRVQPVRAVSHAAPLDSVWGVIGDRKPEEEGMRAEGKGQMMGG